MRRYTYPIRVEWRATDASGRIHFTEVLRYFELADHEFFRRIGCPYARLPFNFVRVAVHCEYLGEIVYDDLLEIDTEVSRLGRSSLTYHFDVRKGRELVARGEMTIVAIDPASGRSRPIPDEIRRRIDEGGESGET